MSQAGDALRRVADRADGEGGRAAAEAMAGAGQDEIQRKLGQRSHARGTPTPSAPGTPPAKISGDLRDSIDTSTPTGGGGEWISYAGPSGIIYARIQQKGGMAGRGHRTSVPPRPYTDTSAAAARISEASAAAFYRAVWG